MVVKYIGGIPYTGPDPDVPPPDTIEGTARKHNAPDLWDKHWKHEGDSSWRVEALAQVYNRIAQLARPLPEDDQSVFVDIGGGRGILAERITKLDVRFRGFVIDHSAVALSAAADKGLWVQLQDLEAEHQLPEVDLCLCTEALEHLSERARGRLLEAMAEKPSAMISVPNNRLGPDEEPQHTVKFTAMSFKHALREHWDHVRVEVLGPYLLGVCGQLARKDFKLSVTLPVRDEGRDLEPTLASFRGVADQLVVGIDPRTSDDTWRVAEEYADDVFFLTDPMGPPAGHALEDCPECGTPKCKQYMGDNGINFSWVRNQCIDRCIHPWIFMTEGHERLADGTDFLLNLTKVVPDKARVVFVMREGNGQRWSFPWIFRNHKDIRFKRPVHNVLDFPEGTYAVLAPQVRTLHERHAERGAERAVQRRAQNRRQLMDDWHTERNVNSLFYLGSEWREHDARRAIERLDQFLEVSNNGVQKYQARLILAKEYMRQAQEAVDVFHASALKEKARLVLMGCAADDWCRTEHWVWLGDLSYMAGDYEKARMFYAYSSVTIGAAPNTMWWIDLCYYSYIPAQRLAMVNGDLGNPFEALAWAKRARELLPADAPAEAFQEADANIRILQEAIDATAE